MNIISTTCAVLILGLPIAIHSTHTNGADAADSVSTAVERSGTISAWQIQADGSVLFQLSGRSGQSSFELWFKTPASRTATTRLESLVLEAVLDAHRAATQITVTADPSNEVRGRDPRDAIPLTSIGTQ